VPIVSQKQRGLMYKAASQKGGAGGVSQKVAKEFVKSDKPGKLPERAGDRKSRLYTHKRSKG
jgi:hypothetical protein